MGGGAIDPWHIPVLTESCQLRAANGRLMNAPVKMVGISQKSQKLLGARIGAQFLRHRAEAFNDQYAEGPGAIMHAFSHEFVM